MKRWRIAVALLGLAALPAQAHRLDEYLQATILSLEPGRVLATMRLVPGVAVAPALIAAIDSNHDGTLSSDEQRRYAEIVLGDLQLKEDGKSLPLQLVSARFPAVSLMLRGTGEIELTFSSELSAARGQHELRFANHHRSDLSVYLVNTLVPQEKNLTLGAQSRNENQSIYQVTLNESNGMPSQTFAWSGLSAAFRLGVRHIAEGTDHLLFLFTLLLPAPLLAFSGRWSGRATIRHSLAHVLGIVTAFTLGHSLTLVLSALGIIHLSSRPVEVLIAISILISAIHALRPLFPGREAAIAAFFGLIHGLAFASALNELGFTGWYRVVSLLGFNIGIEALQLAIVAAILPALLLLSRTRYYAVLRILGAAFACAASCAWIVERMRDRSNWISHAVERLAQHGVALCAGLWLCAVAAWLSQRNFPSTLDRHSV